MQHRRYRYVQKNIIQLEAQGVASYKIISINYPELKPDTEYTFEETTSDHIGQIMDIKGMRDRDSDSWTDTGLGPTHILGSGYTDYTDVASQQDCFDTCLANGFQFSSFATNSVKCRCANSASSAHAYGSGMGVYQYQSLSTGNGGYYKIGSEWAIDITVTNTSNNLPSTFSDFDDNCRYKRKRFYDRIKAVLLQEHSMKQHVSRLSLREWLLWRKSIAQPWILRFRRLPVNRWSEDDLQSEKSHQV